MKIAKAFLLVVLMFSSMLAGTYSGGSGTSADPYLIATKADLIELSNTSTDWSAYFLQTADIVFNSDPTLEDWDGDGTPDGAGTAGFSPIGTNLNRFTGYYNGQNHSVENLYINRTSIDFVGLFGYLYKSTKDTGVVNLKVLNADVTGGGICGILAGTTSFVIINNCNSSGTLNGFSYVGGLVGQCYVSELRNCSSSANIVMHLNIGGGITGNASQSDFYRCYFNGQIDAQNRERIGGLLGEMGQGTASECYSSGAILNGANKIGGLIGSINGSATVSNCYTTVNIQGSSNVGGFIGYAVSQSGSYPIIQNCYSIGQVNGSSSTGGLIGYMETGTLVTNSFWDQESSGQISSAAGTGKTTAEMKTHTTFTTAGWDFVAESANGTDDIWDMDYTGTINNGYPYLNWQDGEDISLPVNLSSFTALAGNGWVTLRWVTESEVNNQAFLLVRSTDGQNFQLLAQIPGQGNKPGRTEYQFTDHNVINGQTYYYRLADRDVNGKVTYHNIIRATPMEDGVKQLDAGIIENYALYPAYPNPFNPETTIRFDIPNREHKAVMVNMDIFDLLGRKVATLYNGMATGGSFEVKWDGRDDAGNRLPSGMYLINFKSDNYYKAQKVILAK